MRKLRVLCCKLAVAALALLLSGSASAATLARQCGAFGIVTYDLPPVTETQTTPVPVPYAWLDAHVPGVAHETEAYESSAKATAANGRPVWACYALGLDPQDATSDFLIASFPMKSDGTPDLENITVDPPKAQWNVPGARPVVKGTTTLDGEWKAVEEVAAAEKAAMRFFKVVVEVP